jgi:hypothetical protein
MFKSLMYKNKSTGALLVIWKCKSGNLIGEIYDNGVEKRGKWDRRARFRVVHGDAQPYRVLEYFGFDTSEVDKPYWSRNH